MATSNFPNIRNTMASFLQPAATTGGRYPNISGRLQERNIFSVAPEEEEENITSIIQRGAPTTKTTTPSVIPPKSLAKRQKPLGQRLAEFAAPSPEGIRPQDIVREIPGAIAELPQSMARNIASVATTIAETVASKEQRRFIEPLTSESFKTKTGQIIADILLGEKPTEDVLSSTAPLGERILSAENTLKNWSKEVQDKPLKDKNALSSSIADLVGTNPTAFAFAGIVASAGLDTTFFGGGKKESLKAIKNVNKIDDAIRTLKLFGATDDVAKKFADSAVKATTDTQALKIIDDVSKEISGILPRAAVVPEVPEAIERFPGIRKTLEEVKATKLIQTPHKIFEKLRGRVATETAYKELGDGTDIVKVADRELSPLEMDIKKAPLYDRFKESINNKWIGFREFLEDDWIRVKKLMERPDVKITEATNPYEREILFHGRVSNKIEQGQDIVRAIDKDIVNVSKTNNINPDDLTSTVNDYLIASHAPERNAQLGEGAAGITTKEAKRVVAEIEASPLSAEVQKVAQGVRDLNRQTLEMLRDSGVISEELFTTLTKKYSKHVPLNRIFEETENIDQVLNSKGFDVWSTGLKRAKGSEREVEDILTNVVSNYEQAALRSEKNIVDNATLNFARENPGLGLFEEIKPKAIGKTFTGDPILKKVTDPMVLTLRENGKPVYLKIKDPHLSAALRGVNRQKVEGLLKGVKTFTRFYSGLMTRFNPEFAIPNKIRDLQEMMVYTASKGDIGFEGAAKAVIKDKQSMKGVVDHLRDIDSEGAQLYKQLIEDGGTTGGMALSTKKQLELDINKIRKLNRSKPKAAGEALIRYIDNWNTIFEDSTRLSVYKVALESGLSRQKSAVLAKEATINFNKMGMGGPVVNALYMFSNASIQGSAKMLRAMKNPKVATTVITAVGTSVGAVQAWNNKIDPNWRDKISKWDRLNGLNVMLPEPIVKPITGKEINYITIPVSWGIKPMKVMWDGAYDIAQKKGEGIGDMAQDILASILEAYNPAGGTDVLSAITPTILDLPVDIGRNQSWTGSQIRPDWDKYAPASIQYFSSLKESGEGRTFIRAAEKASELTGGRIEVSPADLSYGYRQLIGGTGRFTSKIINTLTDIGTDDKMQVKEIPFFSRFLRSYDQEVARGDSKEVKDIRNMLREQSRDRFNQKQDAENMYQELKKMTQEEAAATVDELIPTNPDLVRDIYDIMDEEAIGLTYPERLMKELGVQNGERARYVYGLLQEMKTDEEKAPFYQNLIDKKIISNEVDRQIEALEQGEVILP